MSDALVAAICLAAAFLAGGVPFGYLVGRVRGVDVRRAGSGNIGAANVGRLLGKKFGYLVFLLDVLKGFMPTLLTGQWLASAAARTGWSAQVVALLWLAAGLATVLGHNYSPFLGFKGGKGIATSFGAALGVFPHLTYPALVALAVWVMLAVTIRISSVASLSASAAFPIAYIAFAVVSGRLQAQAWPFLAFSVLLAVLSFVRHRANLRRLLRGTEPRFGDKPAVSSGPQPKGT